MDRKTQEKKERLLFALEKGLSMIHLDARRPGVLVPTHLRGEPHLLLNLSYRFEPFDLAVGEWGVRATLTFQGERFLVAVPWTALYAISSHVSKEFWMYPDDMPKELLEQAQLTTKVPVETPPAPPPRTVLRPLDAPPDEAPAKEDPPKPPARGHLRLVK